MKKTKETKKFKSLRFLFIIVIFLILIGFGNTYDAYAATYYLATNGSDSNPGTESQPWATFAHAFSTMLAGDTLIIKDGTYYQPLHNPPSGTASQYTTVKAENNGRVVIDFGATWREPLRIDGRSYIQIEGIKFKGNPSINGLGAGLVMSSHHIKIIKNAFYNSSCVDNSATFAIGPGSRDILVEECWAFGCGRYKFLAYQSQRVIFRRCVSRHDYHDPAPGWGRQSANFTVYDTTNFSIQNCIGIDSSQGPPLTDGINGSYGTLYGGIWFENNANVDTSGQVLGSIFLNLESSAALNDPKIIGVREIKNTVIWNSKGGYGGGAYNLLLNPAMGTASLLINHLTAGNIWGTFQDLSRAWGTGAQVNSSNLTSAQIRNSIIYGANSYGVADYITSDYNDFYNNTQNYGAHYGVTPPSPGANDRYINPNLKYITRIENDSPLKGAASDGGDIGANIIYRYGVSGTLWGEPGYDQLTNEPLWPFPNEDQIKKDMASYAGPGPSGKRGFCADGTGLYGGPITLTSYIWEYLGNPCPPEICNYRPTDTTPPSAPKNLRIK